jgi:15-cis-phytoene synthase
MTAPDDAFAHCEALVRTHDKDRFLASLFAPAAGRRGLHALYAFNLEVARIRAAVREPMAGAIRLQWWRDALSGERAGEAMASPVAAAINLALAQTGVDPAPLIDLIELRRAELFGEPVISVEPNIFLTAARLLGGRGEELHAVAEDAGLAYDWSRDPAHRDAARQHYTRMRAALGDVSRNVSPAFLPAALVPLRLAQPDPPQWRQQITLARAAWFGFPGA